MQQQTNKKEESGMKTEFLLSSEVARLKQVTPATVRNWANRGILPAQKTPNGTRIFRRIDIEKFESPRKRD